MREDLIQAGKQCYSEFGCAIFGTEERRRIGDRMLPENTNSGFIKAVGQPFAIVAEASREEAEAWGVRWNALSGGKTGWPMYIKYFYKAVTE